MIVSSKKYKLLQTTFVLQIFTFKKYINLTYCLADGAD